MYTRYPTFLLANLVTLVLMILVLPGAVAHGQQTIRVAVQQGVNSSGTAQEVVQQLNANTNYNFDATLVRAADIESINQLRDYNVVIVGHSGFFNDEDWTAQMWAAMRDWVDTDAGGVVAGAWIMDHLRTSTPGWQDAEYIIPGNVSQSYTWVAGSTQLDFSPNPTHPIVDGIAGFAPGSNHIEVNIHPLATNDIVVGTAGGGNNRALIVRENLGTAGARTVYTGVQYMCASSYNVSVLRSGVADDLLARMVFWAAEPNLNPPEVTAVAPDPVNWDDTLTITGDHLDSATVTIGGVTASVTSNTTTQIEVTVSPDTPVGAQTVEVTTTAGTDDSHDVTVVGLAPAIAAAAPDPVAWLETLTIDGSYLAFATVRIGGVEAGIISNDSSQIVVEVADGTPLGVQTVEVEGPVATDTTSVTVDSVAPTLGGLGPDPVGWIETLTITGTALLTASSVSIGGVESVIEEANTDSLLVRVSSETPLGDQPVEVVTLGGSAGGLQVTVVGVPPVVSSVEPQPVRITQTLTIHGEALAEATSVTLGGVELNIISNTATEIQGTVTSATPVGEDQPLVVTTAFGSDDSHLVDVLPAPIAQGRGCASAPASGTGTAMALLLMLLLVAHGRRRHAARAT